MQCVARVKTVLQIYRRVSQLTKAQTDQHISTDRLKADNVAESNSLQDAA